MKPALPSATPRPDSELEELCRIWRPPSGFRLVTAVNNTYIGIYYVATSFLFFLLAGILALLMRTQLAIPHNDLLDQELYNQFFTMHGTIMMFLFAVPAVEAMGVYLLPNMQAARDLPFPRLSAYAFWAYAAGGLIFFGSLFFRLAPSGGWFMYPPLTSYELSPGHNADFWLLGIGFIEISAIAGAVEIVVGVLRTRAPGMTLDKLPIYAWAMLVFAAMIIFGFPAVILGTALLEIERSFHWPFFVAEKGGDPLLWQHLFWFFGHPEVYIIFLPAAGFVSTILPTMVHRPLVAYRWVVLGLIATGFFAFGVWVHHMFATGIPALSVSFFSAASMAVAVPSGIQVFAWIATLASGRPRFTVPMLFVLGFLFIFTIGGLTGVMIGMVPFNWQVHDTYFIVGHFHYVLIGGMVFPFFGALYYWIPHASERQLSERLGRWVFGLMFVGFNVAFFPMHITGLLGMPRRVWTYQPGLGWELLNLVSTAGAYVLAAGVLLFVIDLLRNFRPFSGKEAGNVWDAPTLEWLPNDVYGTRSIPFIDSRDPLWDSPELSEQVRSGAWYLPDAPTRRRETIVTSPLEARPQYVVQMPGPSWPTVLAAWSTAIFFFCLTIKALTPAMFFGAATIALIIAWMWTTDPGPTCESVHIGGGIELPVYATGVSSHSGWAMVILILVAGSVFASLVFSYLFLWTVSPEVWPTPGGSVPALPSPVWPLVSGALLLASSAAVMWAGRRLAASARRPPAIALVILLGAAIVLLGSGLGLEVRAHWQTGLRPTLSSYGAVVYMVSALQGTLVVTVIIMALYTVARALFGLLDARRRVTFDNTALLWHYAVAQGIVGLALVHVVPRVVA